MVDYFRERMAGETPRCELEFIAADLRDAQRAARRLRQRGFAGPVLVITEGLLVYLERDQVPDWRATSTTSRTRAGG